MHYKTIKLNIKIPLNMQNFNFGGTLCVQSIILRLLLGIFLTFAPPIKKMDRSRWSSLYFESVAKSFLIDYDDFLFVKLVEKLSHSALQLILR